MAARPFRKMAILGAGSWGTAMAVWLAGRGHPVTLWGHDRQHIGRMRETRRNDRYLPGVPLPPGIVPVEDLADVAGADLVIFVAPSKALGGVAEQLRGVDLAPEAALLSCTKGLELGSGRRMSEVLAEHWPEHGIAVLSGPSHAEEVARDSPTAVVLGAADAKLGARLQSLFNAAALRVYTSDDVAGIELGGALKNIYAIAAGLSDGLGLGDNAKAALVTRCLAELVRLGTKLGGRRETFQGLSGVGDLMVTCFSRHSRNRMVGERLGRGESLQAITDSMCMVAEGVPTVRSAFAIARSMEVETPVLDQVNAILYGGLSPAEALRGLFLRDPRRESDAAAIDPADK
jgi:glycerol-3-phosphate dehydrogenase (NAD(P)+)